MQMKKIQVLPSLIVWHHYCYVRDMMNSQDHNWRKLFDEATAESDLSQLQSRINAAETAMFMRMQAISNAHRDETELKEMHAALKRLRTLQISKLNFPRLPD